jgi:hypothetical protein
VWAYASRHHLGHDTQRMMMDDVGGNVLKEKRFKETRVG